MGEDNIREVVEGLCKDFGLLSEYNLEAFGGRSDLFFNSYFCGFYRSRAVRQLQ